MARRMVDVFLFFHFWWWVMRTCSPQPGRCSTPNMAHQLILVRDNNPAHPLANMLIRVVTSTYLNSDTEQRQGCSEHVLWLNYSLTLKWRFPFHGGTPSHHPFLGGISPNKNHQAIGVPPWLWKPPNVFPDRWDIVDSNSWRDLVYEMIQVV